MTAVNFDFETLTPTHVPPGSPPGALNRLFITQSGLTIDISRGQGGFDIVSNIPASVDGQQKPAEFGQRSLTPFANSMDPSPFTVDFSANVYRVSVTMGDYGQDEDILFLQAYSGLNGTGDLLAVSSKTLPGSTTQDFSSQVLTLESATPIRSIQMIGGTADLPNTVFYDNLTVDTTAPLNDNTRFTARDLGVLSGNVTSRDFVSHVDVDDYYKFSLNSSSNLSLSLTDLTADADVEILDQNGFVISGSYNAADSPETLSLSNLAAGTYYARVNYYPGSRSIGTTPYTLNLNTNRIDNAGNTLPTARSVGVLNNIPRVYEDWVGNTDAHDYYRFSLNAPSDLSLVLDRLSADADLRLIQDANNNGIVDPGEILNSSILSGTATDRINVTNLAAGTYFARVENFFSDTPYQLSLSAIPSDLAGNTPTAARAIGALTSTPRSFADFVGDSDPNDYYRFSLDRASNLNLRVGDFVRTGELSADADVQLLRLNANGTTTLIRTSENSGNASEFMNLTNLSAGNYLVRVYQYTGDTTYNLSLSATPFTPADNAGNTFGTALDVGALSNSTRRYSDWVDSSDPSDYYRFNLNSTGNLSLVLNGLSGDADLSLIQDVNNNGVLDTGEVLRSSSASGTTEDAITINNLAAGTYFVQVNNYDNNVFYTLNLSATTVNPSDWFDQNLRDPGLVSLTRSLATDDNQLSRNNMINIFRNAQDGNVIDPTEQADLRTIVANYSRFNMPDYVRFLSTETANNITANMSSTTQERLIGRYFLGTETPGERYTDRSSQPPTVIPLNHVTVQGNLYNPVLGRARIEDIEQRAIGNCAFMAALGAVVDARPDVITNMITDNGDNTYTVRFYQPTGTGFEAQYVTVDRRLAVKTGSNSLLFAEAGSSNPNNPNNVLWAALVERAYAQWYRFYRHDPTNDSGYTDIGNGDFPDRPLSYITGERATNRPVGQVTFAQIQTSLSNNRPVVASRNLRSDTPLIVGTHAYSVVDAFVDRTGGQRVIVYNPWGSDGRQVVGADDGFINLSFSEFRSSFNSVYA